MKILLSTCLVSLSYAATISDKNMWLWPGVNVSGMEAPKEGDWGPRLTEDLFQASASKGFKGVRLPIKWSAHADTAAPYTVDPAFFARVDTVLGWARKHGLTSIVNMHHYDELFVDPARHTARFLAIWKQIAERYQSQSDSVFFEILNEPHDSLNATRWNALFPQALSVIRSSNPTRAVLIGTSDWGGPSSLSDLELPNDDNLIATFHYYSPMAFTHQGASWVSGANAWNGTRWTGSDLEKMQIANDLRAVANWSKAHNRPVNMGEFGSYGLHAQPADRQAWTAQVARQAEEFGLSWNYWELYLGFGIYDAAKKTWNENLTTGALLSSDKSILKFDTTFGGINLIKNGDFSNGKNFWSSGVWDAAGAATFDFAQGNCAANVSAVTPQPWNIQVMQSGFALEAGHQYVLSYRVKGSGAQISVGIGGGADVKYANYASQSTLTPDSIWTRQILVFKAPVSNPASVLSFNLGSKVGVLQIDDIGIYDQGAVTATANTPSAIGFQMSREGEVWLNRFDLSGQRLGTQSLGILKAGFHLLPKNMNLLDQVVEIRSADRVLYRGRIVP